MGIIITSSAIIAISVTEVLKELNVANLFIAENVLGHAVIVVQIQKMDM